MEMIPIIDSKTLGVIDFKERKEVKEYKLWHLSSLILPIQEKTGKILIQERPLGKTYEGKLDIFGGFVNKCSTSIKLKNKFEDKILELLFLETAIREANEELKVLINGENKIINKANLILLKPFAGFIANNDVNREVSSVYCIIIPYDASIITQDDVQGEVVNVKSSFINFEELISIYKINSENFADGLIRVIENYIKNLKTKNQLDSILNEINIFKKNGKEN